MQTKKILYFYDALCGWCYGFSPVMQQLYEHYRDECHFEVISGGMVLGEREGPIGEVAGYIKEAYQDVERLTGITFGPGFLEHILEPGEAVFSSLMPALGLSAFNALQPGNDVAFAGALQRAIYFDGHEPTNLETYRQLATEFSVDPDDMEEQIQLEDTRKDALRHFQKTQNFNIAGFPALVLEMDQEMFLVSRGYQAFDSVSYRINQVFQAT